VPPLHAGLGRSSRVAELKIVEFLVQESCFAFGAFLRALRFRSSLSWFRLICSLSALGFIQGAARGPSSVIRQIPAASLKLEAGMADQLFNSAIAEFTLGERLVSDLLKGFKYFAAFGALIFVNRHLSYLHNHYYRENIILTPDSVKHHSEACRWKLFDYNCLLETAIP
jgi:hypothetical protein